MVLIPVQGKGNTAPVSKCDITDAYRHMEVKPQSLYTLSLQSEVIFII
jgi:hypothetical protein